MPPSRQELLRETPPESGWKKFVKGLLTITGIVGLTALGLKLGNTTGLFGKLGWENLNKVGGDLSGTAQRGWNAITSYMPGMNSRQQLVQKLDKQIQQTEKLEKFMKNDADAKMGFEGTRDA